MHIWPHPELKILLLYLEKVFFFTSFIVYLPTIANMTSFLVKLSASAILGFTKIGIKCNKPSLGKSYVMGINHRCIRLGINFNFGEGLLVQNISKIGLK